MAQLPPLPEVWGNYAIRGIEEVLPPDAVSWWPQAPGWRYVGILLLILLGWYAWRRVRHWLRNRYRREALRALDGLEREHRQQASLLVPLSRLLKATALQMAPREEVAALSGEAWPLWLNIQVKQPVFTDTSCRLLSVTQYQSSTSADPDEIAELFRNARTWLIRHIGESRA